MTKSEQELRARLREMAERWTEQGNRVQKEYYNDSGTLWNCAGEIEDLLKEVAPVDPFAPSTEEPTVDSAGWIELAYLPGTPHMAEYYADTKEFFFAQSEIAVPGKVARHWLIPKPVAPVSNPNDLECPANVRQSS